MTNIGDLINMSTIYLLCLPVFCIIYWLAYGRYKQTQPALPGPSITPFMGNFRDFRKTDYQLHLLIDHYYKKFGPVFTFFHQGEAATVIGDDHIIKEILGKRFTNFHNRKFFINLPWPCHEMITMAKDAKAKFIRSLLSPAFTPSSLKKSSILINTAAITYTRKLEIAAQNKECLDIIGHSKGFVMEALLAIAFSIDCPNQSDFNNTLVKLAEDFTRPPRWVNVLAELPFGRQWVKYIPSCFKNQLQPFIDTALGIVAGRRKDAKGEDQDLLDALLAAQKAGVDKEGNVITDSCLLGQGIVLLTAVQVATSTTLAITTYYIAKHKDVQSKIQKEIDECSVEETFPTWDHLTHKLHYLGNVIEEAMRLYPSAYMLMRECTEDCTIENISFKKGEAILIPAYSIHRDENYWNEPEEFNPDRFSTGSKKHYLPFGAGPRACPGNRMSLIEIKMMLAKMLQRFDISLNDKAETLDIRSDLTVQAMLTPCKPILVKATERNV